MKVKQFIQNRSKKTWIILTALVLAIVGIAYFANMLSSPSQGIIIQAKDSKEKPSSRNDSIKS